MRTLQFARKMYQGKPLKTMKDNEYNLGNSEPNGVFNET